MLKRLVSFFCLATSVALAQAPSPAQMGLDKSTASGNLSVLDRSGTWVPLGQVDSTTHTFVIKTDVLSVASVLDATLFNSILNGTNPTPANPGATGDVTAALQTAINNLAAANGGNLFFPAAKGVYWVCGLTIPGNVTISGNRFGSTLKATALCPQGPVLSAAAGYTGNAWNDITRMLNTTAPAAQNYIVVKGLPSDVLPGHYIMIQSDNGGFDFAYVSTVVLNTPSSGLTTINLTSTLSNQASAGNPWKNLSALQQSNISIRDLQIDGNSLNQTSYYSNIVNATSPPSSGSVPFNSSSDIVIGSTAYSYFGSNLPVLICTTANEGTKTITVTGYNQRIDYSYPASPISFTIQLPNATCAQSPGPADWMRKITNVSVSGNMSGNLYVGIPYGQQSGSCLTLAAPFYSIERLLLQHCKGFAWVSNWTAGGGGFNSSYADTEAHANEISTNVAYQGMAWINGPNDSKFTKIIGGAAYQIGFWLDRLSVGTNVNLSHMFGSTPGTLWAPGFMNPWFNWIVDCDSCQISDSKGEQAITAQMLIRANNVNVTKGLYWATQTIAIQGLQTICFQIGDTAYNTTGSGLQGILEYNIDSQCKQPGGSGIYFVADGGWGRIYLLGDDYQTTLGASYSAGATSIKLGCGSCTNLLASGMTVVVTLNSGVQQVTLGAYNSGTGEWAVTALSGNATSGAAVYRSIAVNGTAYTGTGKSDIRSNMNGVYNGYFTQTAP